LNFYLLRHLKKVFQFDRNSSLSLLLTLSLVDLVLGVTMLKINIAN